MFLPLTVEYDEFTVYLAYVPLSDALYVTVSDAGYVTAVKSAVPAEVEIVLQSCQQHLRLSLLFVVLEFRFVLLI